MRTVWLNGGLVAPEHASISIDSVAVRFGEGLFETMYGVDRTVPRLESHLARIYASAQALDLDIAPPAELRSAVQLAVAATNLPHQRVRLSAAPGLVLVEVTEAEPLAAGPRTALAVVVPDSWFPGRLLAEHKTLSYGSYRLAQRRARRSGATIALLADRDDRLGEADIGNVFAAIEGELVTPPVSGLLPGIARSALLAAGLAREGDLTPDVLGAATELFATNAVHGVTVLSDVAGASWSSRAPSALARRAHAEIARTT